MAILGLIAGKDQFPILLSKAAAKQGLKIAAVAFEGETEPSLADHVEDILWVKVGQLQRSIDFMKSYGVTEAVMAGGLTKEKLFLNLEPDERALSVMAGLRDFNDDIILRAMAEEFEKDGIAISSSTICLPDLPAPPGVLTSRKPTEEERADIEFGMRIARELGRLDVGQCVVVRNKTVCALEAIDGSDETIRRGGRLAGENAVVVKICKPGQDLRFDLPSVGTGTIEVMARVKAAVLAVEAGRTLMFDREEMIAAADRNNIAIVALEE